MPSRTAQLTPEQRQKLHNYLRERDFQLWVKRIKATDLRAKAEQDLGFKIRVSEFAALYREACRWWRKEYRPRESSNYDLDAHGWDALRAGVARHAEEIKQLDVEAAAAYLCRCGVRCSVHLLRGLTSDQHIWKEAPPTYVAVDVPKTD